MNIILLIIRRSLALFQQRLQTKGGCLNNFNFDYFLREQGLHEKLYYFFPQPSDTDSCFKGLVDFISTLIAPYIVYDLRGFLLDDLIRHNYFYFRKEERAEILSTAQQSLEKGVFSQRQDTYLETIRNRIKDYLLYEDGHLNMEGFVIFRLPDYRRELKRVVDAAVDRYLKEKEYREFVRLLKYFLELQEPKIDLVHLAVNEQGQFQITDHRFQVIDPREWEEFDIEECEGENDYEDILVSMLVTVAPRRIVLHQNVLPRYPRAVETLRRIFDYRILFCKNCYYCRQEVFQQINWEKQ